MSFTFERQKQKLTLGVSSDGRPTRTYSLFYLCKSDSQTELSVADVCNGLGLRVGSPFSEDANATLGPIEIDRLRTRVPHCAWSVSLQFGTNIKVPENESEDPTQMRVKRSKRYTEQPTSIIKDREGVLIVNAAGEPFAAGVAVADYPFAFVYEWNRQVPTRGFHKKLNKNTFNGCEPGTLLCLIQNVEVFEGAWNYWSETIEMRHKPEGWQPQPLNAGLKEIRYTGVVNTLVNCTDGNGQNCTEPQPLYDGTTLDGLAGQMIPLANRPEHCVYIDVDHFEEIEFEKIGVREFPE